jgi:2',3'-cyclic-nucleotide 2'-phosphodiesterase (5'-nucleotidase family)
MKPTLKLISLVLGLIVLQSCASRGSQLKSSSEALPLESATVETVVIFATSDIDGNLLPALHSIKAGVPTGGIAALSSYFQAAKAELKNHILWLDGGHLDSHVELPGSPFSNLGISATLGTALPGISHEAQDSGGPLHLSRKEKTSTLFESGDLKVGVIGADVDSTPTDLKAYQQSLGDQSGDLRKKGADFVVLLTDLPISCRASKLSPHTTALRKPNEPQGFCEGPLSKVLAQLPEGTVDAVITSGSHQELHHYVYPRYSPHETAGIPLVSSAPRGQSFNLIYLSVDVGHHAIAMDRTRIEGSFPVQAPGRFHGKAITADEKIRMLISPLQVKRDQEQKEILAQFTSDLELKPEAESSLTDWIADLIRDSLHTDFVIAPLGVTRNSEIPRISAGPFSRADLNALFPVPIPITSVDVKGSELKELLKISETSLRGFGSVSGLEVHIWGPDQKVDVEGLESKKTYRLAVPYALIQGADDWQKASQSMGLAQQANPQADLKTLVADWLKKNPSVNAPAPRLHFDKGKHKAKAKARKRKKRHS